MDLLLCFPKQIQAFTHTDWSQVWERIPSRNLLLQSPFVHAIWIKINIESWFDWIRCVVEMTRRNEMNGHGGTFTYLQCKPSIYLAYPGSTSLLCSLLYGHWLLNSNLYLASTSGIGEEQFARILQNLVEDERFILLVPSSSSSFSGLLW